MQTISGTVSIFLQNQWGWTSPGFQLHATSFAYGLPTSQPHSEHPSPNFKIYVPLLSLCPFLHSDTGSRLRHAQGGAYQQGEGAPQSWHESSASPFQGALQIGWYWSGVMRASVWWQPVHNDVELPVLRQKETHTSPYRALWHTQIDPGILTPWVAFPKLPSRN